MATSVTVPEVRAAKGCQPLVAVTAYDTPGARIADQAGVDIVLVGDSVGMVVAGYDDTLHVTMRDMEYHVGAVARAARRPLLVADMPWMSYHLGKEEAIRNAAALVTAGARAVKLEGGSKRVPVIKAILNAEIPVMGHIGLMPQSTNQMGGFKRQGTDDESARSILDDASALEAAGCFAIVIESVPEDVAKEVTQSVSVPTIGIGAGPFCDGQVLVFHDVLGLGSRPAPKFAKQYASLNDIAVSAISTFADDVRSRRFP